MSSPKALTLTQPWATLMALQAKTVETRSWHTKYRGELIIHAAKGFPSHARLLCAQPAFSRALKGIKAADLPRGRAVCIVELVAVVETDRLDKLDLLGMTKPSIQETVFGDFTPGRWAWITRFVRTLDHQGEIAGSLGLWDWVSSTEPEL